MKFVNKDSIEIELDNVERFVYRTVTVICTYRKLLSCINDKHIDSQLASELLDYLIDDLVGAQSAINKSKRLLNKKEEDE